MLVQLMARAFSRALERAGSSMEARIAMIAITTSSSIRVNVFFICESPIWVAGGMWMKTDATPVNRRLCANPAKYQAAFGKHFFLKFLNVYISSSYKQSPT